ncbi:hypothetical protein E2C01_019628 [Portunus trituberculatus]|uniref:Uncharacterized protein n=1 Tax=Portunus trituberculatus TaxID=210409 RepID=A0A5B7DYG3_PORTR|nr:hypothetical protein [Portunus trituberculatus]
MEILEPSCRTRRCQQQQQQQAAAAAAAPPTAPLLPPSDDEALGVEAGVGAGESSSAFMRHEHGWKNRGSMSTSPQSPRKIRPQHTFSLPSPCINNLLKYNNINKKLRSVPLGSFFQRFTKRTQALHISPDLRSFKLKQSTKSSSYFFESVKRIVATPSEHTTSMTTTKQDYSTIQVTVPNNWTDNKATLGDNLFFSKEILLLQR